MGLVVRSSTKTNTTSRTLPATQVAMTSGDDQDLSGPSEMPYMSRPRPAPPRTNPGRSNRPASPVPMRSRNRAPKMMAAMPRGRLTKKTQRQLKLVTRRPPRTGPSAGAIVVGMVRMLAARTRSAGGKTRKSMAMPTGAIIPPPAPWKIRATTSWVMSWANPHSTEPTVNTRMATRRTRFPPK